MRGDGDVDSEGWEYNWAFRDHGWRPRVKSLNRGGWVRRRQWVRLMMKPVVLQKTSSSPETFVDDRALYDEAVTVWRGDAQDLTRCLKLLRLAGRDSRRLELWKRWLQTQTKENDLHSTTKSEVDDTSHRRTEYISHILAQNVGVLNYNSIPKAHHI
jgi:hypothetical protein